MIRNAFRLLSVRLRGFPSQKIVPLCSFIKPHRHRARVVLPAPFWPVMAVICPLGAWKDTPSPYSRTVIGRPQLPNHQAVCSSRWAWLRRGHRYLRNAPQSHGAAFLLGQSEEIFPVIFPFQLPAPQIEHPISKIRSVPKAVLCHQHGLSALFQLFQDLPELADTLPIQIGGRLVQYKQLRPPWPRRWRRQCAVFLHRTEQKCSAPAAVPLRRLGQRIPAPVPFHHGTLHDSPAQKAPRWWCPD